MANNDSNFDNTNTKGFKMDKIVENFSDVMFKGSMAFLAVIININWLTEFNVNIAATIIGTLIAIIFGYWRIKTEKLKSKNEQLIAEIKQEELKATRYINEVELKNLKEQVKDKDNDYSR